MTLTLPTSIEDVLKLPDSFDVALDGRRGSRCAASRWTGCGGCDHPPIYVVHIAYCGGCGEGHRDGRCPHDPDAADDSGYDLLLCVWHGAAVRQAWACFRTIRDLREDDRAAS